VAKTKYLATVIKVDGSLETVEHDGTPSLRQLQAYVGGNIQRVPLWTKHDGRGCTVYADEEGRMFNKPFNKRATLMWMEAMVNIPAQATPLVGDVVIVQTKPKEK
jgi:hypothetical protein